MKKYIIKICCNGLFESRLTGTTASCTDYLDKAPESDVTPENAFKDFHNFQGFVEEPFMLVFPTWSKQYWSNSWNWGEDEVIGVDCNYHMGYKVDQGDFWGWQAETRRLKWIYGLQNSESGLYYSERRIQMEPRLVARFLVRNP